MAEEINKSYLKEKQYKSTKYLEARIKIHQFTKNQIGFHEWIFSQYDLSEFEKNNDEIKILDVGCGTGVFWKKNANNFKKFKINITFTDYSSAMNKLVEGRGNLINSVEKIKKLGIKTKKSLPESILKRSENI